MSASGLSVGCGWCDVYMSEFVPDILVACVILFVQELANRATALLPSGGFAPASICSLVYCLAKLEHKAVALAAAAAVAVQDDMFVCQPNDLFRWGVQCRF